MRYLVLAMGLIALACTLTVGSAPPSGPGTPQVTAQRGGIRAGGHTIVLVAVDGVRWQEVFHGVDRQLAAPQRLPASELVGPAELMPNLHTLIAEGAALGHTGTELAASGPHFVSVPGYMEMLGGQRPSGCANNTCGQIRVRTVADDFASRAASPLDVAVISSWEGVGRAASRDPSRLTLSVGRSGGVTRERLRFDRTASDLLDAGVAAGPAPGHGDFRRDQATAALALHYLRSRGPRFLFLGLGEADEFAHQNDYRGYLKSLAYADHVIGTIATALNELESRGRRTTLFVTTDHGRSAGFSEHGADAPESASVWLVARGFGIDRRGLVSPARLRHLADIAATIRKLSGIAEPHGSSAPILELLTARRDS